MLLQSSSVVLISTCLWHEDLDRRHVFNGRPLVFCEQSALDFFAVEGHQVVMIPPNPSSDYSQVLDMIDRLVFHGGVDRVVKTKLSRDMTEALKKVGSKGKYTEYPNVGHYSWSKTYRNDDVLAWLFEQKK